jgi:hypothetical protein
MPKLNWGAWLYGLWVAVVGGAASAVTSAIGVSLLDPGKYNVATTGAIHDTIRLVLTIFAINAIFLFFVYLAKHPAPEQYAGPDRRAVLPGVTQTQQPATQQPPPPPDDPGASNASGAGAGK